MLNSCSSYGTQVFAEQLLIVICYSLYPNPLSILTTPVIVVSVDNLVPHYLRDEIAPFFPALISPILDSVGSAYQGLEPPPLRFFLRFFFSQPYCFPRHRCCCFHCPAQQRQRFPRRKAREGRQSLLKRLKVSS